MKKLSQPQITSFPSRSHYLIEQNVVKNLATLQIKYPEVRIVYFGTPEFSAYILEKLIEFSQNPNQSLGMHLRGGKLNLPRSVIQVVVTSPDKRVGRKQTLTPSAVSRVAHKYSIPTLKPVKLDEQFIKSHLSFLESDLFIVASYGKILPQALLDIPTLGSINVHGSLLPKYRGASPIQTAILNGDQETGVTIMFMDAAADHGPILSTKKLAISNDETFQSLSNKMSQIAAPLLIDTILQFVSGKIKPRVQNHARATFTKLITKEDGYFDINSPPSPTKLNRMIHAYYPWPNAWTIWEIKSQKEKVKRIVKFLPRGLVQMEGKKAVPLKDFLHGYPDFPIK